MIGHLLAGGTFFRGLTHTVSKVPAKSGGHAVGRGLAHALNRLFDTTKTIGVTVATKTGAKAVVVGIHDSTLAPLYPGPVTGWITNPTNLHPLWRKAPRVYWQIPARTILAYQNKHLPWNQLLQQIRWTPTRNHPIPPMTPAQRRALQQAVGKALQEIRYVAPHRGLAKGLLYAPPHHAKVVIRHAVKKFFQAPPSHTGVPTPEVPPVPIDL